MCWTSSGVQVEIKCTFMLIAIGLALAQKQMYELRQFVGVSLVRGDDLVKTISDQMDR